MKKITVKLTEKKAVTTEKEIELPYYVKHALIEEYSCITEDRLIITAYASKGYNRIDVISEDRAPNFTGMFNDIEYKPTTKEKFFEAMDKAIKNIGKDIADFVGIETSLLP